MTREELIKAMDTAVERHAAAAKRLLAVPVLRSVAMFPMAHSKGMKIVHARARQPKPADAVPAD